MKNLIIKIVKNFQLLLDSKKLHRKQVYQMMLKTLKAVGISQNEIDWVVPHQASGKAIDAYSSIGKFDKRKVRLTSQSLR